ncbi:MAG: glycosyltransferase family 2 protein [Myxococcales bacterium]|nr:glycosyltransferase family 2 protein [Myxococcales bacterium]
MKREHVIALIPALDCASTIGDVVGPLREQGYRVLVVDDGSQDATAERARAAGAELLRHAQRRGKGAALVSGFRWALSQGAHGVLTLDADLQHDPASADAFVDAARHAELVIGARTLDEEHMPRGRLFGNRFSTFFIGLFLGEEMHDTQCGYRLYSRTLLESLPLSPGGFETETELLMRAHRVGLRVGWVPIETIYPEDIGSRFDNWRDTLRVIRVVLSSPWYPHS